MRRLNATPLERIPSHREAMRERNAHQGKGATDPPSQAVERAEKFPIKQEPPQPFFFNDVISEDAIPHVLKHFYFPDARLRVEEIRYFDSALQIVKRWEIFHRKAARVRPVAEGMLWRFLHAASVAHPAADFQC